MGFLFFAWIPPLSAGFRRLPPPPRRLTIISLHFSSHTIHLTHLITTHLTPLAPLLITHPSSHTSHHTPLISHISSPLISHPSSHTSHHTPLISHISSPLFSHPSSHSTHLKPLISHTTHLTPLISQHSSQTTHLTHLSTTHLTPLIRRLGRGCLSCGRRSTQSLLKELRSAWPPLGLRPFVWQAQYTEPSGGAAARVAAACMGRGFLSCGRRSTQSLLEELQARVAAAWAAAAFTFLWQAHAQSILQAWPPLGPRPFVWQAQYTQSLLEELRRAWPPLGPRLPFVWQAQYTELRRAWPPLGPRLPFVWQAAWAAAFRVAGAVHRAFWRSCRARGRRLGRGWLSLTTSTLQILEKYRCFRNLIYID